MSPYSQNDSNYNRPSSPSDVDSLLKPEACGKKRYSLNLNRRTSPDPDTTSSRDSSRKSSYSKRRSSFLLSLKSVLSWRDHGLLSPPASPKAKHKSESRPPPKQNVTGQIKPLPPLPIVDSEATVPERTDYIGSSFRTVYGRKYHICTDHVYPLPVDDDEIDRMQTQHYVLKELFEDNLFHAPVEDKLKDGVHVLDLGCGCGSWCMEMATQYPNSTFIGLDVAPIYPTSIIPSNCSFQSCDVTDGLPFVNESFDFVISRDMALSMRFDDWKQYIEEMTRVTRKNGYIELVEMDW
ncbi:hypothetical protein INT43_002164 [Umbelopsis isabellina]|uniref:Methyltransferase domain-containing protein n=1 Tax=Mortierella isabellina TaxID=91625 RepID=A0A8H7Q3E3_MORIS|nr:hypothetical protein INT43_002164 [Umbelopsis isabellina]